HYANNEKYVTAKSWNGSMTAARKLSIVDGQLKQEFIGETHSYKVNSTEFEFVYENGSLKFKLEDRQLHIDRSELWDDTIPTFQMPAAAPFEITALFDTGSIELVINGQTATALLDVGSEKPVLRSN
ncbi:MAG: hypothetical protein KGM39_06200, partial [Actinomycetales bacterium]|nr:hypothetical protein [Actinomycetales bacterium]